MRLGLIAGNGRFPLLFAEAARKKGAEVVAIGIKEETDPALEQFSDRFYWLGPGELERLFELLKREGVKEVVMAGQVKHKRIFDETLKLDSKMSHLLSMVKDKKTDSLLGAISSIIETNGIKVLDSTLFLSDFLAEKGVMAGGTGIDKRVLEDIEFGKAVAKEIARLDIGQTVVVKEKTILAVESIEGTDETIKRGALYGRDGVVAVKVSKPSQDMRFDVPTIGPRTVSLLKEVKAACIAVEAGKTIILDKDRVLKEAGESGVGVIGI